MAMRSAAWGEERGQAAAEFVAIFPALILATLVAIQLGVAGWTAWSASEAAKAGARAQLVGDDPEAVARAALPTLLRDGAEVDSGAQVDVTVVAPTLVPGLPDLSISGSAGLAPGAGL
ncbi:pilus assembly protein [Thermoleophilia bacterium SCSIO 60948]|nr:pilus assembly protein [Thermoleophilia bacterium SCSIO 60948]